MYPNKDGNLIGGSVISEQAISRNARMRQARDRAAAIRAAQVDTLIADRAERLPVMSNIVVTPIDNPQFATLPDLESFLRHSNLTYALEEYIRARHDNLDADACLACSIM